MDRRWIVFPAIAATAAAQSPEAARAEKALRARVEEFFQLQVSQKYRQAESLVADEAKDDYYSAHKPKIDSFKIAKVEFTDGGKKARVMVISKTVVNMLGAGPTPFDAPSQSTWKLEHGKWCWYMDQNELRKTPFGEAKQTSGTAGDPAAAFRSAQGSAPSLADMRKAIQVEPKTLDLVPGGPAQKLVVTNGLEGPLQFKIGSRATPIAGLSVDKEVVSLVGKGSGEFLFSAKPDASFDETVILTAEPFGMKQMVRVRTVPKQ